MGYDCTVGRAGPAGGRVRPDSALWRSFNRFGGPEAWAGLVWNPYKPPEKHRARRATAKARNRTGRIGCRGSDRELDLRKNRGEVEHRKVGQRRLRFLYAKIGIGRVSELLLP